MEYLLDMGNKPLFPVSIRYNPNGKRKDFCLLLLQTGTIQKYLSQLRNPQKSIELLGDMSRAFAAIPPDSREARLMEPILQEMAQFLYGTYSLYSPMPEEILQAERQAKQAEKEARRKPPADKRRVSETPDTPGDRLAAAARALAQKGQNVAKEDQSGQFDLFSMLTTQEPKAVPPPEVQPSTPPQVPEQTAAHTDVPPAPDEDQAEKQQANTILSVDHKAQRATFVSATPQKPGRTKPELNYRNFAKMFPEIASGEYRYLCMEAGEAGGGMMPLHLEWINTDIVAVSHTYVQNGDLMRDPEMTFRINRENGTLEPLTFRQDGSIQIYQEVYPEPGRWIPKLSRDLSSFAQQWLKNISEQNYHKREAVIERDGEDVRLTFDQDGKVMEPAATQTVESGSDDRRTVREIYEHYKPIVKDLVLADEVYRNACINSDQQEADIEGRAAVHRAALTIQDPAFMRQYFDHLAFHNRLHQEIVDETYPILSQPQQEQDSQDVDTAPYNFELEYRQLSRMKADCDYFLGAGGRHEKHLSGGGSVEQQIAKMRELYDAVSEKPEWLTAEDIDRYEQRMTAPEQDREWPVSPVTLYRDLLDMVDREINRGGWLYEQLRDRNNDYDGAKEALDSELYAYVKHVASGYPDIMAAYHTLQKFREWLIEDLMERNYQDVSLDRRDAPDRYSNDADTPEWAKGAPPTPVPQYEIWSAKGPIIQQKSAQDVPSAGHSEPEQPEAGAKIPPAPETVPEPTGAGVLEQLEMADSVPAEPDLAPNVDEYLNLKAAHPGKLVGVQVGDYMLFYGMDAQDVSAALDTDMILREIEELGNTFITGSNAAWQATLKKLLEHGKSVVLAQSNPEHGPNAPYEIIKERNAADYIPLGMELTIDGRHMIDFDAGTVSLQDLDMKGWFPIFRSEPIPFVREYVEEVQRSEEYIAADMANQLQKGELTENAATRAAADEIPRHSCSPRFLNVGLWEKEKRRVPSPLGGAGYTPM